MAWLRLHRVPRDNNYGPASFAAPRCLLIVPPPGLVPLYRSTCLTFIIARAAPPLSHALVICSKFIHRPPTLRQTNCPTPQPSRSCLSLPTQTAGAGCPGEP